MRAMIVLGLLVLLTACSGDPASYGITGPGIQKLPVGPAADTPDSSPTPGISTTGSSYGPSNRPTTGGSGFWGYN
ncbi:MAG TPA: hypothetical protein VGC82_20575 [Rhodopila sp.]|jgi:hypothetical protein